MARQRYINTDFWRDEYIEDLDPLERYLYIYFLTNPLTNIAGIYKISIKRVAFETGLEKEMVIKIIKRFEKANKIAFIEGYIIIKNFIKHQKVNPNIQKGIDEILNKLPESVLNWLNDKVNKPTKALESPSKTLNYINVNVNDNTNVNNNKNVKKEAKASASKEFIIIRDLYFKLYEDRFKLKPMFDATEGTAIKNLLSKIDFDTLKSLLERYMTTKEKFWINQGLTLKFFQTAVKSLRINGDKESQHIDDKIKTLKTEDYNHGF